MERKIKFFLNNVLLIKILVKIVKIFIWLVMIKNWMILIINCVFYDVLIMCLFSFFKIF